MNRLSGAVSVLLMSILLLPVSAQAAEITRILSSFDDSDPFDIDLQIGYSRTQRRGKITQEYHDQGQALDVLALRTRQVIHEMPMELRIGLYKDLEISVTASLILSEHRSWRLPTYLNVDKDEKFESSMSTVLHNRIAADGTILSEDAPIIDLENHRESYSSGFGNLSVGIKWAPLSETRDQYLPDWVLGFQWTIPTADVHRPNVPTTSSDKGDIGDGVHRLKFSTAFSKRFGYFDPYISGWYSLPVGASKRYNNCNDPESLAFGNNCEAANWSEKEVSMKAPHMGGFFVGTEFIPWDNPKTEQKVSLDIRAGAAFIGSGRTYNELSDALGKLLWTESYARIGGSIGLTVQPIKYLSLHFDAGLWYETSHLLTGEPTGKDLDGLCPDTSYDMPCVDTNKGSPEINPNFDFRYDVTGRRFRVESTNVFTLNASVRGQF